jgi:hypothetical protein
MNWATLYIYSAAISIVVLTATHEPSRVELIPAQSKLDFSQGGFSDSVFRFSRQTAKRETMAQFEAEAKSKPMKDTSHTKELPIMGSFVILSALRG